jgi:hypothetical protein
MKDEECRSMGQLAFLLTIGILVGGCSIYDIKDRVEMVWRDTFSDAVEESTLGAVPGSVPENHVGLWRMEGTASIHFPGTAPRVPETCPESCLGHVFSVYQFPPGSRRLDDPPGTSYPDGWQAIVDEPESVVAAIFDPGTRGVVVRTIYCRPWGSSTPEPVCSSSALVETADVFSDGFESGDTSRWRR